MICHIKNKYTFDLRFNQFNKEKKRICLWIDSDINFNFSTPDKRLSECTLKSDRFVSHMSANHIIYWIFSKVNYFVMLFFSVSLPSHLKNASLNDHELSDDRELLESKTFNYNKSIQLWNTFVWIITEN